MIAGSSSFMGIVSNGSIFLVSINRYDFGINL